MADEGSKFAASISAMAGCYPSLEFRLEERDSVSIAVWEGWLQPIRMRAGLTSIVCDLDADRPVAIDQDTCTIGHDPNCDKEHRTHRILKMIKHPDRRFLVRIEFKDGPSHPRGYLLDPVVTPETHYHMFTPNRICAYPPQTDVWRAADHTVADYTDHVLIWLFKWNTWVETGHWLGTEMPHDPWYLYAMISPTEQCWCGSGETYGDCHRAGDREAAKSHVAKMAERLSPLYQWPRYEPPGSRSCPSGY
jgi:hypothetical protein